MGPLSPCLGSCVGRGVCFGALLNDFRGIWADVGLFGPCRLWGRGGLWAVSGAGPRGVGGLSCCGASVALCLWFRFWASSMIVICSRFSSPEGVINDSCGSCGRGLSYWEASVTLYLWFRFQT